MFVQFVIVPFASTVKVISFGPLALIMIPPTPIKSKVSSGIVHVAFPPLFGVKIVQSA